MPAPTPGSSSGLAGGPTPLPPGSRTSGTLELPALFPPLRRRLDLRHLRRNRALRTAKSHRTKAGRRPGPRTLPPPRPRRATDAGPASGLLRLLLPERRGRPGSPGPAGKCSQQRQERPRSGRLRLPEGTALPNLAAWDWTVWGRGRGFLPAPRPDGVERRSREALKSV